jgi:hypothetical protein
LFRRLLDLDLKLRAENAGRETDFRQSMAAARSDIGRAGGVGGNYLLDGLAEADNRTGIF